MDKQKILFNKLLIKEYNLWLGLCMALVWFVLAVFGSFNYTMPSFFVYMGISALIMSSWLFQEAQEKAMVKSFKLEREAKYGKYDD